MNENLRDALDRVAGAEPHIDLSERAWVQGRALRRRRQTVQAVGGITAAVVLLGGMWLGGGLRSGPDALPGPAEQPTEPAVTSVDDVGTDEATDEVTEEPTEDGTATEDTGTATTAEDLTTEETAPPGPVDPCSTAYPDPVLAAEGLPEAAAAAAHELLQLAAACDLDGLSALAEREETHLSFGVVSPQAAFSGEEGAERAAAVTTLLTQFEPGQDAPDAPYRWPVEMEAEQDWARLVDSGLYSQEEVDLMRSSGIGYTGWRVGVDATGGWAFLVAGD